MNIGRGLGGSIEKTNLVGVLGTLYLCLSLLVQYSGLLGWLLYVPPPFRMLCHCRLYASSMEAIECHFEYIKAILIH